MLDNGQPTFDHQQSDIVFSCFPSSRFTNSVKIGQGTSGEIYSATDLRLKRTVALKMVRSSSEQPSSTMTKSQNEVRILSRIHHPSVIQLLDVYRTPQSICLIQPFCKHGSLDQWLQQEEMSSERVIPMFRDLLEAVQFVHSCGLVHADIKPSNVLVDDRCRVFLCDFELSREAHEKSIEGPSCELVGSIGYMAPELIEQKGVPTFQSDIYSLGVTLYELLAKERAFPGPSSRQCSELCMSMSRCSGEVRSMEWSSNPLQTGTPSSKRRLPSYLQIDTHACSKWRKMFEKHVSIYLYPLARHLASIE